MAKEKNIPNKLNQRLPKRPTIFQLSNLPRGVPKKWCMELGWVITLVSTLILLEKLSKQNIQNIQYKQMFIE